MLHYDLEPKVSVVIATANRSKFLDIAIALYCNQTYANKELIIVDDSQEEYDNTLLNRVDIIYIYSNNKISLGDKLNLAISRSTGDFIHKMDDDDFYSSSFLYFMISYHSYDKIGAVSFLQPFLFFNLKNWKLLVSDKQRCSGATFFFRKDLWEEVKFRNINEAIDACFLIDVIALYGKSILNPLINEEAFLQIRHGKHTWNNMPSGETVDDYLENQKTYTKSTVEQIVPDWILQEYSSIHHLLKNEKNII